MSHLFGHRVLQDGVGSSRSVPTTTHTRLVAMLRRRAVTRAYDTRLRVLERLQEE